QAVSVVMDSFKKGGRLIYIGAGTSGRLGILDAVECPPTFGTDPEKVQGLIAGGEGAIMQAVGGAEDDPELASSDLKDIHVSEQDAVMGLDVSGRTPRVVGGLQDSKQGGADSVAISCKKHAQVSESADIHVVVEAGLEILTGTTRVKAGTVQKLVVNMILTC